MINACRVLLMRVLYKLSEATQFMHTLSGYQIFNNGFI